MHDLPDKAAKYLESLYEEATAAGRAFRAGALSDVKLSWKSFMGAVTGR